MVANKLNKEELQEQNPPGAVSSMVRLERNSCHRRRYRRVGWLARRVRGQR